MPDILRQLRSSGFRDISGSRFTATVPLSESLVNQLIASSLPPNAPVRSVVLQAEAGDRLSVRVSPKAALIPALTLELAIDEQPQLPGSAVLVLRMATLSGLFGLASGAITGMLPPGVRLDGERIRVDLRTIAHERGLGDVIDYLTQLHVRTEQGRIVLHVEAAVG